MNLDIENLINFFSTCLDFQQTKLNEKLIHHEIPGKPWEVVGVNMFSLHNRNYLCIVDYHSKFPNCQPLQCYYLIIQ